ncbi:MBL fold metallo-hydrolase [Govanella unica]|uniref:beta-lactamase n=1 Tax=Govanella unica TaxID=2975056 RepID=A0A9X3TX32_9PROT|nr:MBL fold metallo-hydrolase [Govania unica]MDA5193551.1 MBL fold metallo-hydrolase [Govania unica]
MTVDLSRRAVLAGLAAGLVLPGKAFAGPVVPQLYLQRLTADIWMHVSWIDYGGTAFGASNGLVVRCGDRVVLVDTPCTEGYTAELLDRIRMPVAQLIITHAHSDRLGGIAVTEDRGIPSLIHELGLAKAVALGYRAPSATWNGVSHRLTIGGRGFELFFPGGAHSFDNTVVYLPDARLLFGGCMVRGAVADNPGGIEFADVCNWPRALMALEQRFPKARIVVPGHGDAGGFGLLRHTARLVAPPFQERGCV